STTSWREWGGGTGNDLPAAQVHHATPHFNCSLRSARGTPSVAEGFRIFDRPTKAYGRSSARPRAKPGNSATRCRRPVAGSTSTSCPVPDSSSHSAGEALGVHWSPGFTGGTATTADVRLLLYQRSIVVEDRAEAALLGEPRVTTVAEQVEVEGLVGLP